MASAGSQSSSSGSLASRTPLPIAQLNPDLPDLTSRAVHGEVTLTWPYSSITNTLAFLIAEPDVRLRRVKGQVRIRLHGPSAKAVAACGLGAGDEVHLGLDGVHWATEDEPGRIPGARLEWQLQFGEKLTLQVKLGESGELKHIDVDQPQAQAPAEIVTAPEPIYVEPEVIMPAKPPTVRKFSEVEPIEYASPAFMKRARISYGALWEDDLDIFKEDGGVKGKGRKRTRFVRDSNAWRYSSQSPSPEPSTPVQDAMDEDTTVETPPLPSPRPQMADEGSQTVDVEMTQVSPPPASQEHVVSPAPADQVDPVLASSPTPTIVATDAATAKSPSPVPAVPVSAAETPVFLAPASPMGLASPPHREELGPTAQDQAEAQDVPQPRDVARPDVAVKTDIAVPQSGSSRPTSAIAGTHNTLFGTSKPASTLYSMFGTPSPVRVEPGFSIADQVRFGFSHVPQAPLPPSATPAGFAPPDANDGKHEAYPESFLDSSTGPAQFADMTSYISEPEHPTEVEPNQRHRMALGPTPTSESLGHSHWDMPTQSPHYPVIEEAHFSTDALNEEARTTGSESSVHPDITEDIPEGFASYGSQDHGDAVEDRAAESPDRVSLRDNHPDGEAFEDDGKGQIHNDSEDSVEYGDGDAEDDAEYDELGPDLEEGDYDQRNYNVPADDDEGVSDEDNEMAQEEDERYGDEAVYDEDEEDGEEWDGMSDEYDESEDDQNYHSQSTQGPATTAPKEPVVISLLSDSEDDDEPPLKPSKPVTTLAPQPYLPNSMHESTLRQPSVEKTPEISTQAENTKGFLNDSLGQVQIIDFAPEPGHGRQVQPAEEQQAAEMTDDDRNSSPSKDQLSDDLGYDMSRETKPTGDDSAFDIDYSDEENSDDEGLFVRQSADDNVEADDNDLEDRKSISSDMSDEKPADKGEVSGSEHESQDDHPVAIIEVEESEDDDSIIELGVVEGDSAESDAEDDKVDSDAGDDARGYDSEDDALDDTEDGAYEADADEDLVEEDVKDDAGNDTFQDSAPQDTTSGVNKDQDDAVDDTRNPVEIGPNTAEAEVDARQSDAVNDAFQDSADKDDAVEGGAVEGGAVEGGAVEGGAVEGDAVESDAVADDAVVDDGIKDSVVEYDAIEHSPSQLMEVDELSIGNDVDADMNDLSGEEEDLEAMSEEIISWENETVQENVQTMSIARDAPLNEEDAEMIDVASPLGEAGHQQSLPPDSDSMMIDEAMHTHSSSLEVTQKDYADGAQVHSTVDIQTTKSEVVLVTENGIPQQTMIVEEKWQTQVSISEEKDDQDLLNMQLSGEADVDTSDQRARTPPAMPSSPTGETEPPIVSYPTLPTAKDDSHTRQLLTPMQSQLVGEPSESLSQPPALEDQEDEVAETSEEPLAPKSASPSVSDVRESPDVIPSSIPDGSKEPSVNKPSTVEPKTATPSENQEDDNSDQVARDETDDRVEEIPSADTATAVETRTLGSNAGSVLSALSQSDEDTDLGEAPSGSLPLAPIASGKTYPDYPILDEGEVKAEDHHSVQLGQDDEEHEVEVEDDRSVATASNHGDDEVEDEQSVTHEETHSPSPPETPVRQRNPAQKRSTPTKEVVEEQITVQTRSRRRRGKSPDMEAPKAAPQPSGDLSVQLARQAVEQKRSKKSTEPLRTSPMVTRGRSSSLQMSATPEVEDNSVSFARASMASPSKSSVDGEGGTTALKQELSRRLRSDLPECVSLKTLRTHVDKFPNVVAVVTTQPPPATRAKGGPREYMMSFLVTDPSISPSQVVEVQLYRAHKESLPVVKPGDAILLQRFQVKALSKKGFGLRTHSESAWAVFDADEGAPQIKGPPVEDYADYTEYMTLLRAWYRSLNATSREKLEKANKKIEDVNNAK